MTSLVLELQQAAMDSNRAVTDLLRMAIVVATKLSIQEFSGWAAKELSGYGEERPPEYRGVSGDLRAHNPYHGWIPVIVQDTEAMEALSRRNVGQTIGQLESLLSENNGGVLHIPLHHDTLMNVFGDTEEFRLGMIPTLHVGRSQIAGIVDSVRNEILNWSLELESKGVLGEGLTFSPEEVSNASTVNYNINQFTGVLGDVRESSIQVGDYGSIHADLRACGVDQEARNELENLMEDLRAANPQEKPGIMQRGVDWVTENSSQLGSLAETIGSWFS